MPFSRGSSQPRDQTHVSYVPCIGSSLPLAPAGKPIKKFIALVKNEQKKKKKHKIVFGILENLENISGIVG